MGGQGSGRWGGHTARPLAEQALRLDLEGPKLGPVLQAPEAASGILSASAGGLHLQWSFALGRAAEDGSREWVLRALPLDPTAPPQVLRLEPTRAGFSRRLLARCPGCDRRARFLHPRPERGELRCGRCAGVAYASQRVDPRVRQLANALRTCDSRVLRQHERKMEAGGYGVLAAAAVTLDAFARAFPRRSREMRGGCVPAPPRPR